MFINGITKNSIFWTHYALVGGLCTIFYPSAQPIIPHSDDLIVSCIIVSV